MQRETEHIKPRGSLIWAILDIGSTIICGTLVVGLILAAFFTGNWLLAVLAIFPAPFVISFRNWDDAEVEATFENPAEQFDYHLDGEFASMPGNVNHQTYMETYHPPPP